MRLYQCEIILRPRLYLTCHQVQHPEIQNDAHVRSVCFVWISE